MPRFPYYCYVSSSLRPAVPVPVPGDFSVRLGDVMPGETQRGLEEEMAALGGAGMDQKWDNIHPLSYREIGIDTVGMEKRRNLYTTH